MFFILQEKFNTMKKLSFLVLIVLGISFFSSCKDEGYKLKLDKDVYAPGETIKVDFTADPNWSEYAWVGIIPSNVSHGKESENDQYDLEYQYLSKKASGTVELTAPSTPGNYDIRMNDADDGTVGLEITYVSFKVK